MMSHSIQDLPPELLLHTLKFLGLKDITSFGTTSSIYHRLSHDQLLWKFLIFRDFGFQIQEQDPVDYQLKYREQLPQASGKYTRIGLSRDLFKQIVADFKNQHPEYRNRNSELASIMLHHAFLKMVIKEILKTGHFEEFSTHRGASLETLSAFTSTAESVYYVVGITKRAEKKEKLEEKDIHSFYYCGIEVMKKDVANAKEKEIEKTPSYSAATMFPPQNVETRPSKTESVEEKKESWCTIS